MGRRFLASRGLDAILERLGALEALAGKARCGGKFVMGPRGRRLLGLPGEEE